jgi:hypothetical protein
MVRTCGISQWDDFSITTMYVSVTYQDAELMIVTNTRIAFLCRDHPILPCHICTENCDNPTVTTSLCAPRCSERHVLGSTITFMVQHCVLHCSGFRGHLQLYSRIRSLESLCPRPLRRNSRVFDCCSVGEPFYGLANSYNPSKSDMEAEC